MIDQHSTLGEKFIKKGFWLYLFTFLSAPLGYIIKIMVSHDVSVEELGIIYGVMSLVTLVLAFNDLGMSESLNKFIPEYITKHTYDKAKTALLYAILAQIVTGSIIFIVLFFGSTFIGNHFFHESAAIPVIQVFSFFFLGYAFFHVFNVFFGAVQNTLYQKLTEFLRMCIILGFTIWFFLGERGDMMHYSSAWVLGAYIGILLSLYLFIKSYYLPYFKGISFTHSKAFFKTIFSYALLVFLGAQASTILGQIDMQMIIYILGMKDTGYYTNYLSIISIPFVLIGPILAFLFPVFSELIAKQDHAKITLIKQIFYKHFGTFSFVFSLFFVVFGPLIAQVLFGEKFTMSGIILQRSAIFLVFNFLLQINFNILAANGRVKERLYIILKAIGFNIVTNLIFIYFFGVVGAALATGLGWILIWYLSEKEIPEYQTPFEWRYFLKNTFIYTIFASILYLIFIPYLVDFSRGVLFGILAGIGVIYFGVYALINKKDFLYFIKEVKKVRNKS